VSTLHVAFTVRSLFATDIPRLRPDTRRDSRSVLGPCIQITGLPSRNMSARGVKYRSFACRKSRRQVA